MVDMNRKTSSRRVLVLTVFAALVLMLQGCGGSGGLAKLPVFTPGSVTDDQRDAALTTMGAEFTQDFGKPNAAALLVAKMKTLPQFAFAEINASGDAQGWFTDGKIYFCITSDPPQPTGATPIRYHVFKPKTPNVLPKDLTASPNAYLINAFEPLRPDPAAAIRPELTNQGYNVTQLSGIPTDYSLIQNAGLLFVHAHGTVGTDDDRVERFWYSTPETQSRKLDKQYINALEKGTMAYGTVNVWQADGTTQAQKKYAISDQYLHDSGMTFASNATWISQACNSFNPAIISAAMDSTKGFSGVAVYGGWTIEESSFESNDTSLFIFDRMLGVNTVAPVDPANPPPATFALMSGLLASTDRPDRGIPYNTSLINGIASTFKFQVRSGTNVPTIMPVISSTESDMTDSTLTITGIFGSPQGNVTLDGSPLTVQTWTETTIVTDLPSANTGTLLVRSLGGSSSSGYLFSNSFAYSSLGINLLPPTASLKHKDNKTFSVSVTTGQLPPNAKYRYTLTGKGKLSGGSPQTTGSASVTYNAPNVDCSDAIKVEVLDSSNHVRASANASVAVGNYTVTYTVTGDMSDQQVPPFQDGTVTVPFLVSFHTAAAKKDFALVEFEDQSTGKIFALTLSLAPGSQIHVGDTFGNGTTNPGGFNYFVGINNSIYGYLSDGGTVTITSVTDNGDGSFSIGFTGTESDSSTGSTMSASGTFLFHYSYDH